MSKKSNSSSKKNKSTKFAVRVVCFILALSMVATTFFMLISYLMDM